MKVSFHRSGVNTPNPGRGSLIKTSSTKPSLWPPTRTLNTQETNHQLKNTKVSHAFPRGREEVNLHLLRGSQHAKYVHPGSEDPAQRSETLPPAPSPPPHSHSPVQPHFLEPECTQDTARSVMG